MAMTLTADNGYMTSAEIDGGKRSRDISGEQKTDATEQLVAGIDVNEIATVRANVSVVNANAALLLFLPH